MATHTQFPVETDDRVATVDITETVRDHLPADADGTCTVFVTHTTAGVSINEAEPRLLSDIESAVTSLVPESGWGHDELDGSPANAVSGTPVEERPPGSESTGNADAHLRSMLLGRDVTVPVADGDSPSGPGSRSY